MTKLDVELPAALSEWVEARVASGLYLNEDDYIRDLIRRDLDTENVWTSHRDLDERIAAGLADIEAGRVYDADEVFAELRAMIDAEEVKQAAE